MARDIRTLPPLSLRMLLALLVTDTAAPLPQAQRDAVWHRLRQPEGTPPWLPTVDDCGVAPKILQQWFDRCNRDLRIYVNAPYHGETPFVQQA